MFRVKTRLRRWGNSLGIVIPLNEARRENLAEGDDVMVLLGSHKKNILRETFGIHRFKKPVHKLMKEVDKDLYGE